MTIQDPQTVMSATNRRPVALVQLPFPSQSIALPVLTRYYQLYEKEYQNVFPEYKLAEGDLWEAPLWVAHMDGAIGRDDTCFIDLSRVASQKEECVNNICREVDPSHFIFFSPLAQNLALASEVSRVLMEQGYCTVIGGNMAELAHPEDFSIVYNGLARADIYEKILSPKDKRISIEPVPGHIQQPLGYSPSYRLLSTFGKRVPLVRLHGSHGCLFGCTFCGDAWTKQLHLVERARLKAEVDEIRRIFPDTRLIYIGDKTFGQSKESVENLRKVILPAFRFRLIVQTHVTMISPWLLDAMEELGVEVVEMGFETASSTTLRELKKLGGEERFMEAFQALNRRGLRVILNVLGGLPNETRESQQRTLDFLEQTAHFVWLYNLYNFVPYPKTPLFPMIRDRIVDWNFQNWREDGPIVFTPFHQTREEAWEHFLRLVDVATNLLLRRQTLSNEILDAEACA